MVAAFVGMSWYFGFGLEYRFEVTAISITWLTWWSRDCCWHWLSRSAQTLCTRVPASREY